jgi:exodeoxyribonuclease-3
MMWKRTFRIRQLIVYLEVQAIKKFAIFCSAMVPEARDDSCYPYAHRPIRPTRMKLATWNINSLKIRLPHVLDWLTTNPVDVLCLQETKVEDANFPIMDIEAAGYHVAFSGQRTYNGVGLVSRAPLQDVTRGIPNFADEQRRVIAGTYQGVRVVCAYFPNGQSVGSDKYQYKLRWLAALQTWLAEELRQHPRLALLGDYNIAPEDRDVHDPKAWEGQVLVSESEREAFRGLLALGLKDSFRLFEPGTEHFTWWDYRMNAFRRKRGLRIDLLASARWRRVQRVRSTRCRAHWSASDHTPVIVEIDVDNAAEYRARLRRLRAD